jgi:Holliday junction resolvase RusA-like endonuclease
MCSKWVNDTLQTNELISNDNVQYLVREIHEVAEQDRENPRCEITIKEIDE